MLLSVACVVAAQSAPKASGPVDILIAVIASPTANLQQKWQAGEQLQAYGDQAVPGLLGVLAKPDTANSRWHAIRTLGHVRSRLATKALCGVLSDRNDSIRRYAAIALGQIGDPNAVGTLVGALSDAEFVRNDALDALVKIDSPDARKALEEYHFGSPRTNAVLRIACAPTVVRIGDRLQIHATLVNESDKPVALANSRNRPRCELVFQSESGGFVETIRLATEDAPAETASIRLEPGRSLSWDQVCTVESWTRGEREDQSFVRLGGPFPSIICDGWAFHVRKPGCYRVRMVIGESAASDGHVKPAKIVSNSAAFTLAESKQRLSTSPAAPRSPTD